MTHINQALDASNLYELQYHHAAAAASVPWWHSTPAFLMITQFKVAEKQANLSTPAHIHLIDSLYCLSGLELKSVISPELYDLENSTVIALAAVCFKYYNLFELYKTTALFPDRPMFIMSASFVFCDDDTVDEYNVALSALGRVSQVI